MTGAPISLFCFIRCCVLIGTMWASSPTVVRRRVVGDADPYGSLVNEGLFACHNFHIALEELYALRKLFYGAALVS